MRFLYYSLHYGNNFIKITYEVWYLSLTVLYYSLLEHNGWIFFFNIKINLTEFSDAQSQIIILFPSKNLQSDPYVYISDRGSERVEDIPVGDNERKLIVNMK